MPTRHWIPVLLLLFAGCAADEATTPLAPSPSATAMPAAQALHESGAPQDMVVVLLQEQVLARRFLQGLSRSSLSGPEWEESATIPGWRWISDREDWSGGWYDAEGRLWPLVGAAQARASLRLTRNGTPVTDPEQADQGRLYLHFLSVENVDHRGYRGDNPRRLATSSSWDLEIREGRMRATRARGSLARLVRLRIDGRSEVVQALAQYDLQIGADASLRCRPLEEDIQVRLQWSGSDQITYAGTLQAGNGDRYLSGTLQTPEGDLSFPVRERRPCLW